MSEKQVPNTKTDGGISPWVVIAGAGAAIVGVASLVRSGYEMGINQSRKILRRHDKEQRMERKKWKLYFKEQRKMNKAKKEGP